MRITARTILTCLIILAMSFNPAVACRSCHSHWGGYHSYGSVYSDCGDCGGCATVVYEDCCGGCDSCDGAVIEEGAGEAEKAPAPAEAATAPEAPEQPATVDRPLEEAPAPVLPPSPPSDDLFNGTEEATPPAETETPAEQPNDLFGPPAEEPAESAAPAVTPPAETTPPAEATPPAETTEEPADDLFGTEPAATEPEATEDMPADTDVVPPQTPPADEPTEEEAPKEEETDDIFGASRSILREAGGLASDEMRLWVDNTGNYSCGGRLVRFLDGHVRILKTNGRTTTVPLYRLSAGDLEFVNRQASAQKAEAFQTAHAPVTMPMLGN
jgi:hypothetical protein